MTFSLARENRPSGEAGFTLMELLVGLSIGLVVLFAGLLVMDSSLKLSRVTQERVDATQRGRLAMELVTRELRSEVCLTSTSPPLVSANDTQVTFYTNLAAVDTNPQKHQISLENGDIILRTWVPTGTPPSLVFPVTATTTKTLLENVQLTGTTPFLTYYSWNTGGSVVTPSTVLTTPLSATDLLLTVKIGVSYTALPARSFNNTKGSSDLQDSVYVRSSDPTDPTKGPKCN